MLRKELAEAKLELKRKDKVIEKLKHQYIQEDLKYVISSIRVNARSTQSTKRISIISQDFCKEVDEQLDLNEYNDEQFNLIYGVKTGKTKDETKRFANTGLNGETTLYFNKLDSRID